MKTKKKILMIDLGKSYGGAEKLIENIVIGLKEEFEFTLALDNNGEFREKSHIVRECDIIYLTNDIKNLLFNVIKLRNYVNANKIDIIHCHGTPSNLIGLILKKICRVKFITTIHSDLMYEFYGKKRSIYSRIERNTLENCDCAVAVSGDLNSKLKKRCKKNRENILLIRNGIDVKKNCNIKKNDNEMFKFLFVGRLVEIKNIPLLLDGLKYVKGVNSRFICNIIGDGEERESIEVLIKNLDLSDNVKLLGYKDNIQEYMLESDALILTSKMEGIPITIIEAFANKIPVVSSAVGGVLEIVENNKTGVLYSLDDKFKFYNILLEFVNGEYKYSDIVENAYDEYLNKWNCNVLIQEYKKIYL
ncbi:glycosyltransferase [Clostridium tertium]|uniref:glycosyltransferase n=1 Tax=Clostridium tertium TaxID=1559 RepID=UPI001AE64255|nr:glycosyltransferase [Clostridium tertium]MBP1868375.1 glycosyltransferase involved in cell wall biosynthesis [Clostridium tertium]